jgi:hypothetical protein
MGPETFAEFLTRQGHHVVKTETCFWYDAQPGFYFYFPYHRPINPGVEELKKIIWGERCIGIRFFTPMECIGKSSYNIVCSDKNYDFTSITSATARHEIRKGLKNFEIRQMDFKELATLGISLNYDTLVRQGRAPRRDEVKNWRLYCSSTEGLDGFEAWGAFLNGKLASFEIGFLMEDCFYLLRQSSATEYLPLYPNNALVFALTRIKLALPEVNTVSQGPQSLDAPESLDTFKFRMGYQKQPMKQKIIFNPMIRPFIGGVLHKFVQLAVDARPQSDTLRKLEGIIRFYREAD